MPHPCLSADPSHEPRTRPGQCSWCDRDLAGGVHHRNLSHGGQVDPDCPICERGEKPVGTPLGCVHLGEPLTGLDRERAGLSHQRDWRPCSHPEQPLGAYVCTCAGCGPNCRGYSVQPEPRSSILSDPGASNSAETPRIPFGVVIGSYKWPSLIDLQIRLIREKCGPVPILVSDDCSPGFPDSDRYARLTAICGGHPDVMLWPNAERIGHTGGDVGAFWKGIVWGASRGLRVVAKLSQRFLVTRPTWLQEGAVDLLASSLPLATQRCRGVEVFDLRTEAALLDVAKWNTPDVLARILPRRYWRDSPQGLTAETIIYRVLQDLLGGKFWPWGLFGEERHRAEPGYLWHCPPRQPPDYHALAAEHGVELEEDFFTEGWQKELAAGRYLYG